MWFEDNGARKKIVKVDFDQIVDLAGLALIELRTIGPEEAQELLDRNYDLNRNLRKTSVEAMALDMIAERWFFNGDSLRFTRSGVLVDGQHRLKGVIESETEQDFLIITLMGNPDEVYATIDGGRPRNHGDIAKACGYTNYSLLSGIANCVWRIEKSSTVEGKSVKRAMPKTVVHQFIEARPDLQEAASFVTCKCQGRYGIRGWLNPSVAGAAYYFWSKVNQTRAAEFMERLAKDDRDERGLQDPACVLRRKLCDAAHRKRRYTENEVLYLLQKAWEIDGDGTEATRLHFQVPRTPRAVFLDGMETSVAEIVDKIDMTHAALSKRLGVKPSTFSGWYRGRNAVPIRYMRRLSRISAALADNEKKAKKKPKKNTKK
jgi:hypothetical protein